MDMKIKERFINGWQTYFNTPELPIVFYYTDREKDVERVKPPSGHQCIIGVLGKVRGGKSLCFNVNVQK